MFCSSIGMTVVYTLSGYSLQLTLLICHRISENTVDSAEAR